jgi:hypothetical protein
MGESIEKTEVKKGSGFSQRGKEGCTFFTTLY